MSDTENYQNLEAPAEKVKSSPTKRDVTALLEDFKPKAAPEKSPGDKERERRVNQFNVAVRNAVEAFEKLGGVDGPPSDVVAALKGLATFSKKGTAAINSLTDAKLGVAPTVERKPRAAKVQAPEPAPAVDPEPAETPEEGGAKAQTETPEQIDARLKADRAARAEEEAKAAPTQHRSGPSFGARGETDPNQNDGF